MTPIDDLQRLSAGCHMTLYRVARDDLARLIEAGSAGSSRVTVAFLDDMPARAGPDAALQSVATALWRIARDALTDGLDTGWRPAENAAAPLKRWWRQFTLEPSRRPTRSLPTADELRCYAAVIAQGVLVLAAELSPLRPVYAAVDQHVRMVLPGGRHCVPLRPRRASTRCCTVRSNRARSGNDVFCRASHPQQK